MAEKTASNKRKDWAKISISSLEADVAYFDARLALLGDEIDSHYQYAQLKAYKELEKILSEILVRLKEKSPRQKRKTAVSSNASSGSK